MSVLEASPLVRPAPHTGDRAHALVALSDILDEQTGTREMFGRVARLCADTFGSVCIIELAEPRSVMRCLCSANGRDGDVVWRVRHAGTSPLLDRVDDLGHSMLIADAPRADVDAVIGPDDINRRDVARTKHLVVAPIGVRRQRRGAVALLSDGGRHLRDTDLRLLDVIVRRVRRWDERQRRYARAVRLARAQTYALGVIAHDLRNPLRAIGMALASLDGTLAADDQRRAVELAVDAVSWSQRLVKDLLDLSLLDAGKLALHPRPADLVVVLARACAMFDAACERELVTLELNVPDRLPLVRVDEERILQVLANLLSNALRHTPRGRITLGARAVDDEIEVWARDTGSGISAAELPRVFERFRRAGGSRGTGLGLSVARGIVRAHGGRIRIESREGDGTTVTFRLPVDLRARAAAVASSLPPRVVRT